MRVTLGARYQAGRDGATIFFADGSRVQLKPFSRYKFEHEPARVTGDLRRVFRYGIRKPETKA